MPRRNKTREEKARELRRRREILMMAGALFAVYLILSFLFGDMGLFRSLRMKETHRRLQQEIHTLQQENDRLRQQIEVLKHDPVAMERLARERLGYARDGEIVYRFQEPPVPPSDP